MLKSLQKYGLRQIRPMHVFVGLLILAAILYIISMLWKKTEGYRERRRRERRRRRRESSKTMSEEKEGQGKDCPSGTIQNDMGDCMKKAEKSKDTRAATKSGLYGDLYDASWDGGIYKKFRPRYFDKYRKNSKRGTFDDKYNYMYDDKYDSYDKLDKYIYKKHLKKFYNLGGDSYYQKHRKYYRRKYYYDKKADEYKKRKEYEEEDSSEEDDDDEDQEDEDRFYYNKRKQLKRSKADYKSSYTGPAGNIVIVDGEHDDANYTGRKGGRGKKDDESRKEMPYKSFSNPGSLLAGADDYMLKSQMVPPVCPACPGMNMNSHRPGAYVPPCPPCGRCPEPAFSCKKVPNYDSANLSRHLPRPVLADFSQFGM
jgi:hypothetical protein